MFFFKQKTAYEVLRSLVGSEMCIRDRFKSMMNPKGVLVDLKGVFRTKIKDLTYWSL